MKKLNYLLLGAAGLLMASCASEDLKSPANGDGTQITINLCADPGTRADAELPTEMTLNYAVYDSENALVEEGDIKFTGTSTTFNTNLLTGKDYTLAFFAQNSVTAGDNAVYTFDADKKTVSVDYTQMNNSDYNNGGVYDCFYNTYNFTSGSTTSDITVTLYRPLAQINWGTNDLKGTVEKIFQDAAGNPSLYATLETDAYSKFNIMDGSLQGEKTVTLGAFSAPTDAYPVSSYTYVGMQYILASPTSELYDLNLAISNNDGSTPGETVDLVVTSAPLQANYKTNIYGSLLTDNVNLNVELGEWGGSILDPQELGTLESEGLYFNEASKTYTVTSVTGMETFAQKANSAGSVDGGAFKGYTVVLGSDLDYTSTTHTPFKLQGAIFDGQGHTISNLKLTANGATELGFIYYGVGTVQNLNFTDANVSGEYSTGVVVGNAISTNINNVTVSNSTVTSTPYAKNGDTYDDGNNAGIIAGYISGEFSASITNCTVSGCNVTAYRKVGGIVGSVNTNVVIKGNTVKNTTVTANQNIGNNSYDGQPKAYDAGEIYGAVINPATIENNTATGVSVTTISPTGETTASVASQAALQAAVGNPNASITLQPGTYTPPTNVAEGVTFTGTPDAILSITQGKQFSGYTNVTFEGVSFTSNTTTLVDTGFIHSSGLKYINCIFNGMFIEYSTGLTYEGCTFNVDGNIYGVWTYGASDITFSDCNFNTDGKAVLLYSRNATPITVNFSECNFKAAMPQNGDGAGDGKAAIQINGGDPVTQTPFIVNINKCKATGFSDLTLSGNGLWSYKSGVLTKVTVDGEQVYNTINNN